MSAGMSALTGAAHRPDKTERFDMAFGGHLIEEEHAEAGVWEPWVPKLRQVVRVRLSGECQDTSRRLVKRRYDLPSGTRPSGDPIYYVTPLPIEGHNPFEDGMLGTVGMIETTGTHRFGVLFTRPFVVGDRTRLSEAFTKQGAFDPLMLEIREHRVDGGYFAAVELSPLTDWADATSPTFPDAQQ